MPHAQSRESWVGLRKGVENVTRTGIWSADRPARSESLYRLRYPKFKIEYLFSFYTDCIITFRNILTINSDFFFIQY
jgi:hypothetical protein